MDDMWEDGRYNFSGDGSVTFTHAELAAMQSMFGSEAFSNLRELLEDQRDQCRSFTESIDATPDQMSRHSAMLYFLRVIESWPSIVDAAIDSRPK